MLRLSCARNRWLRSGLVLLTAVLGLCLCAGCGGKKKPPRPRVYAVKGTLTLDGQPFGPVLLMLQSPDPQAGQLIRGDADDKGNLKFSTYKVGDGAPAGTYKVWFPKDPLSRATKEVPEIYREFITTNLSVTLEQKKNDIKIALDSKAELPDSAFVDPTIGLGKKKKTPPGKKEKNNKPPEPEKPKTTPIDPKLLQ